MIGWVKPTLEIKCAEIEGDLSLTVSCNELIELLKSFDVVFVNTVTVEEEEGIPGFSTIYRAYVISVFVSDEGNASVALSARLSDDSSATINVDDKDDTMVIRQDN